MSDIYNYVYLWIKQIIHYFAVRLLVPWILFILGQAVEIKLLLLLLS